jgi:lysyl-tRNA synthetase class 2
MLLVSSSLARRKHRAWLLAVVVASASAVLHIAKGLDLEEALASVALLVLLIRSRRWFDAPGNPASLRLLLAGSALLTWLVVAALLVPASHGMDETRILHVALLALTVMTAIWLVHLWLRPWREPEAQSDDDHRRARRIVLEWGEDSLSFFALRRDRRYAFPARRCAARLPRRGRLRAGVGRPGRKPGVDPRHGARVRRIRAPAWLAAGGAALLRGVGRPVP